MSKVNEANARLLIETYNKERTKFRVPPKAWTSEIIPHILAGCFEVGFALTDTCRTLGIPATRESVQDFIRKM